MNTLPLSYFSYSQNILLDAALTAKVADFGFVTPALPQQVGETCMVTAAGAMALAGTRGCELLSYQYDSGCELLS